MDVLHGNRSVCPVYPTKSRRQENRDWRGQEARRRLLPAAFWKMHDLAVDEQDTVCFVEVPWCGYT